MPRPLPDFSLERSLIEGGAGLVAGLDEAGRGPLAGPVVAAAVVLDPAAVPGGLDDSKRLSAARRDILFEAILDTAEVGIASVSAAVIDRIDIRQATLLALCRALAALPCEPCVALVDGNDPPPLPCATRTIVRGDGTVASIAAASIVAKVVRDRMMRRLGTLYPAYGFSAHAGYATARHREALAREGPCPLHRLSFAPIRPVNPR